MSINSFEETESNPDVDSENVQVARKVAVEGGAGNRTYANNEPLAGWAYSAVRPKGTEFCDGVCGCACTRILVRNA